jgi:hypothetical protein
LLRPRLTHLDQQANRFDARAIHPANKSAIFGAQDDADDDADVGSVQAAYRLSKLKHDLGDVSVSAIRYSGRAAFHVATALPRGLSFAGERIRTVVNLVAPLDGLSCLLLEFVGALPDLAALNAHPGAVSKVLPQHLRQVDAHRAAVTTRKDNADADLIDRHRRRATRADTDRVIVAVDYQRRALLRRQQRGTGVVLAVLPPPSDLHATRPVIAFKKIYFVPPPTETYTNDSEREAGKLIWFDSGLEYAITTLAGYLYSIDRLLPPDVAPPRTPYNVFISHGGPYMTHVDRLSELFEAVGLSPVVVARRPSMNLSVNAKVLRYVGICSAGVALATVEDEEQAAAEQRPRPNVEHEIGLMQTAPNIGDRIVYCKEAAVKFASNYAEKVWVPFAKESIQESFVPVLRELHAFGLL